MYVLPLYMERHIFRINDYHIRRIQSVVFLLLISLDHLFCAAEKDSTPKKIGDPDEGDQIVQRPGAEQSSDQIEQDAAQDEDGDSNGFSIAPNIRIIDGGTIICDRDRVLCTYHRQDVVEMSVSISGITSEAWGTTMKEASSPYRDRADSIAFSMEVYPSRNIVSSSSTGILL